jgi:hypothetical protein
MPEPIANFLERKKDEYLEKDLSEFLKHKKQDREIINHLLEQNISNLETCHRIYEKYTRYRNLMKENKIIFNEYFQEALKDFKRSQEKSDNTDWNDNLLNKNISVMGFETAIEKFEDDMENTIINNEARKLRKSVISNKYKHLVDDKTDKIFRELYNQNVKRQEIQSFVTQKIAQHKKPDELNDVLTQYLNQKMGWSFEDYLKKVNGIIPKENIYKSENNIIIFEADSFEASKALGSPMWCVTREKEYFNNYTSDMDRLIFIYDFNKSPEDLESLTAYIVEHDGRISSGYYKDDEPIDIKKFPKIEADLPNISEKRVKEKLKESEAIAENTSERYNLYNKIFEINLPHIIEERLDKKALRQYLDNSFSILFDTARIVGYGAEKSFDFLDFYYENQSENDYCKSEWLTRGGLFIEKAIEGGHMDLAEKIFNDKRFQNVIKEIKDDLSIQSLPPKFLKDELGILSENDKKVRESFAKKFIDTIGLSPDKTFSPHKVSKNIFDFYKKHYPEFIDSLKDENEKGLIYINNLLANEKRESFENRFAIIKDLQLTDTQKEKFLEPLERNFQRAVAQISYLEDPKKIIEDYTKLFSHFNNNNLKTCLTKNVASSLTQRSKFNAFSEFLENGFFDSVEFNETSIAIFKNEKMICLHKDTEEVIDSIIENLEQKVKPKEHKKIKPRTK